MLHGSEPTAVGQPLVGIQRRADDVGRHHRRQFAVMVESHQREIGKPVCVIVHIVAQVQKRGVFRPFHEIIPDGLVGV